MKFIKAREESFEFVLDGLTRVYVLKEGVSVEDRVANEIVRRYGQLVTVEDAPIEEAIATIQTEDKTPVEEVAPAVSEETTEIVVEKTKKTRKVGDKTKE